MPVTWHQARWWAWCTPKDKKKETCFIDEK